MKLNSYKPDFGIRLQRQNSNTPHVTESGFLSKVAGAVVDQSLSGIEIIKPYFNPPQQEFQDDTWVKLLELPSTFSYDEALLLCQSSEDEWVAWIPGHGEAVLHVSQFCALP